MTATGVSVARYTNCKVVCHGDVLPGDVWVREGKIINPTDLFYGEKKLPDTVVDCRGLIVAPGFIDIQINGEAGFSTTSRALLRCPTLYISDSQVHLEWTSPRYKKAASWSV